MFVYLHAFWHPQSMQLPFLIKLVRQGSLLIPTLQLLPQACCSSFISYLPQDFIRQTQSNCTILSVISLHFRSPPHTSAEPESPSSSASTAWNHSTHWISQYRICMKTSFGRTNQNPGVNKNLCGSDTTCWEIRRLKNAELKQRAITQEHKIYVVRSITDLRPRAEHKYSIIQSYNWTKDSPRLFPSHLFIVYNETLAKIGHPKPSYTYYGFGWPILDVIPS